MKGETQIMFLGTASAVPDRNEDTASFIINRQILVDVGWNATLRMLGNGVDPLDIEYLVFTHCHHDHYLSLPALFFYRMMLRRRGRTIQPLKILGPQRDLERVVDLALSFLQAEQFALDAEIQLTPLLPGETFEGRGFRLETVTSIHPVDGLCYRFTDLNTGAIFTFSGDTAYNPAIASLAQGSTVLIHECALGPIAADPANNRALHSGALDAAQIAKAAGVRQLYLVHAARSQMAENLAAARTIFPSTASPLDGETISIPAG